jgi:hypothetical protein
MSDFDLVRVSSDNLFSVGYESASQTLRIKFNGGRIYDYYNVPEAIHNSLMKAGYKGHYHHVNIERHFRYKRIL